MGPCESFELVSNTAIQYILASKINTRVIIEQSLVNRTVPLVVISLATVLFVPTGAVPFGTDAVNEELVMAPAEGPNGDYAVLNEDQKIELLLTGTNPSVDGDGLDANAVTPLSRVFTITYTGNETAEVWLTDDTEDIRFYRSDNAADSLEGADNSAVLQPGESLAVGLLVDTRGDHDAGSAETFTVHAEELGTDDDGDDDGLSGTNDVNRDSGGSNGDDADDGDTDNADDNNDSRVETPTPSLTTETVTEASLSVRRGETNETATPTETIESGGGPPPENGGGPIGLDEIGLGPLLAIAGIIIAIPSGVAAYRWYS